MTFESIIENSNAAAPTESLPVKVSYGSEMRRATFGGSSFASLCEVVAKLFGLDQASIVLKYQDDDDDKITMSSDGELQDALKLAKEKKILRLFVDLKVQPQQAPTAPVVTECDKAEQPPHPFMGYPPFFRGGRGRFGGPGFVVPHHSHPHPHPRGPHQHGLGPHRGAHGFGRGSRGPYAFPPRPHVDTQVEQPESVPNLAQGTLEGPCDSSFAARMAFKAHKRSMKEQIKLMKENASTPEDKLAIKEFKEQMHAELKKAKWCKGEKGERKKGEGKKHEKKWAKHEKKWEKHERKCNKEGRLMARHVSDVTIPDNSELPADSHVTKTWRLRNAGTVAWPAGSQLIFISKKGDNLNGPERVMVGEVQPQSEVEVSVPFITPSHPGRYIGYYRMATSDGSKFGQRVWVSFIVPSALANTTSATAKMSLSSGAEDLSMD